jgi:hypothetical protein
MTYYRYVIAKSNNSKSVLALNIKGGDPLGATKTAFIVNRGSCKATDTTSCGKIELSALPPYTYAQETNKLHRCDVNKMGYCTWDRALRGSSVAGCNVVCGGSCDSLEISHPTNSKLTNL